MPPSDTPEPERPSQPSAASQPGWPADRGRGTGLSPQNRFLPIREVPAPEHFEHLPEEWLEQGHVTTQFLDDDSQSIVAENDSPDVYFRFNLNPYRGCEQGCSYCYARPYHEYLGFNAGVDFESRILVKRNAPALFRRFLARPQWRCEPIALSGVTDCYQPAERRFRLTRGCLEVALQARQPVSLITKNALILRDLDLLRELAAHRLAEVSISLTTLDPQLARELEPRTSPPFARLKAITQLAAAGIPVRVMTAPIIPGLNDSEIPALLTAAAEAGAASAGYVLLRLPLSVEPVFRDWLARVRPGQAGKIEGQIRQTRGGEFNQAGFGTRMKGNGLLAEQIAQTFRVFSRRLGLNEPHAPLDTTQFRPPRDAVGQKYLFD
ncbi:MAG: PA0069 family radical SAM protein [Planctomycetaceae bacterium]